MPACTFRPLSPGTWEAFEKLFGPKGACAGCWCMLWRTQKKDYDRLKGDGNRKAMQMLVEANTTVGLLAFANDVPVGWCAFAPRENYIRLQRSRVLKPVDDLPVWSVSCFFIAKAYRRQGVSVELLKASVQYALKHGATVVEGYPVLPKDGKMPDVFAWTGTLSTFLKAGFKKVTGHRATRPIVRFCS